MDGATPSGEFLCPRCNAPLPGVRRAFPWCECGWNLPTDPVDDLRGVRRAWGRMSRWLGRMQARWDAAWLRGKSPQKTLGWRVLFGFAFLLSVLLALVPYGLSAALAAYGIWASRYNLCITMLLFGAAALIIYFGTPIRYAWRKLLHRHRRRPIEHFYARVADAVAAVADRLEVNAPHLAVFTFAPVMDVDLRIRWSLPPRLERSFIIGLPVLTVLSMSEFKALAGHTLIRTDGLKVWLPRYVGRVLHWIRGIVRPILGGFKHLITTLLYILFPLFLCSGLAILLGAKATGQVWREYSFVMAARILSLALVPLLLAWLIAGLLLWLTALWYRRQTVLADRIVARAYGRNVLLRAIPKLWAAQRSFSQDWYSMAKEAWQEPDRANFFAQFRDRWDNLPAEYKDKAFREVTVGFRSLLYFDPVFEDRAELLRDLPNKLSDDRPASILLPGITDLGANMARNYWWPDDEKGK